MKKSQTHTHARPLNQSVFIYKLAKIKFPCSVLHILYWHFIAVKTLYCTNEVVSSSGSLFRDVILPLDFKNFSVEKVIRIGHTFPLPRRLIFYLKLLSFKGLFQLF